MDNILGRDEGKKRGFVPDDIKILSKEAAKVAKVDLPENSGTCHEKTRKSLVKF